MTLQHALYARILIAVILFPAVSVVADEFIPENRSPFYQQLLETPNADDMGHHLRVKEVFGLQAGPRVADQLSSNDVVERTLFIDQLASNQPLPEETKLVDITDPAQRFPINSVASFVITSDDPRGGNVFQIKAFNKSKKQPGSPFRTASAVSTIPSPKDHQADWRSSANDSVDMTEPVDQGSVTRSSSTSRTSPGGSSDSRTTRNLLVLFLVTAPLLIRNRRTPFGKRLV